MQRQSPKAAQGGTDFAMLPSAHRKPERRDSKAFKMETQFNTGRAWFLSVALLLGTLGFVFVAGWNQPVAAPMRPNETLISAQVGRPPEPDRQFTRPFAREARARERADRDPENAPARPALRRGPGQRRGAGLRAAQTPAHMSTLEAILARMTARPTEKDVAEAERLQKVMAGAD